MAASQRVESASTNRREEGAAEVRGAVDRYLADLGRAPLAERTREAYGQHVGAYAAWLTGRSEPELPLRDPRARDHAARDFKRHLKVERAGSRRR